MLFTVTAMTTARRGLRAGLLGSGALALTPTNAQAAKGGASLIPARALDVGDLVIGPGSSVVRVADARASGKQWEISLTDPAPGLPVLLGAFAAKARFVLLARGVTVSSVALGDSPAGDPTLTIDGGHP